MTDKHLVIALCDSDFAMPLRQAVDLLVFWSRYESVSEYEIKRHIASLVDQINQLRGMMNSKSSIAYLESKLDVYWYDGIPNLEHGRSSFAINARTNQIVSF